MMFTSLMSWGTTSSSQHRQRSLWRWLRNGPLACLLISEGTHLYPELYQLWVCQLLSSSHPQRVQYQALPWQACFQQYPGTLQSLHFPQCRVVSNINPVFHLIDLVLDDLTFGWIQWVSFILGVTYSLLDNLRHLWCFPFPLIAVFESRD